MTQAEVELYLGLDLRKKNVQWTQKTQQALLRTFLSHHTRRGHLLSCYISPFFFCKHNTVLTKKKERTMNLSFLGWWLQLLVSLLPVGRTWLPKCGSLRLGVNSDRVTAKHVIVDVFPNADLTWVCVLVKSFVLGMSKLTSWLMAMDGRGLVWRFMK